MRNKRCMAFAFACIFAFIALAVPRSAFAYEYNAYTIFQNEWYEDGNIDPTQGWIIYANNKYDAALYVCGDNVSSLTDEQLQYLSDPNYGGAFYALAQRFGTGFEHEWIPDYVRPMLALVEFDKVQVGWATTNEIAQAKARLQEVMNGDYGSGGSGAETPDGYVSYTGHVKYVTRGLYYYLGDKYNRLYNDGSSYPDTFTNNEITILVPSQTISALLQLVGDGYSAENILLVTYITSANGTLNVQYFLYPDSIDNHYSTYNSSIGSNTFTVSVGSGSTKYSAKSYESTDYVVDGNTIKINNAVTNFNLNTFEPRNFDYQCNHKYGSGSVTPADPEGDWPSEPVAPTPPELPTPTDPTVPVEPEPTIPEPTIPSDPIYIPVEAPDSTDYTDWLRAILSALNNIDSEIVTLSTNLGDYFAAVNQYLVRLIQDIATHCDHLQTAMNREFTSLKSYLQQLFTWLGEQMQFNFEGYDDTSIISWLRKIYGRLGGGTYKPNPDADPKTFLDWLLEQWNRFFTSLLEKLPDAIGDLVNDFQQLTRFFPFSIPWDLAALLGLFAHAPVTPVFDIPLPFGVGSGYTTNIHIDCTPWDGVAAMVRPCFLAMFCLQLALLTRDLLKGLNVTGGDE